MKKTIIDLFEASVRKYGAKTFLLEKRHHKFEPTTYAETREQALEAGAGLTALGIRPGDKVAILAEGSNAWIISELGLFYAGAVSVPLSVKLEESNDLTEPVIPSSLANTGLSSVVNPITMRLMRSSMSL